MRKALLLSSGVVVALAAAVFVGAAAATTGAPVFYDARYPAPAPATSTEYEVEAGGTDAGAPGVAEEVAGVDSPTPPDGANEQTAPPESHGPTPAPPPGETPPTPGATPTPTPTPDPDDPIDDEEIEGPDASLDRRPGFVSPTLDEQQTWLAFQQIVRECMADAGHAYRYWEWWNADSRGPGSFPAMPAGLTFDEVAAWQHALDGDAGTGHEYRWQDAGCWGYAVHVTGGTN